MATYLLLRNNRQEGPFTSEELKIKGLKPYDLVWVEGKSAAWRYPGEISELASFAPLVEDQPFDRFFKKEDSVEEQVGPKKNNPASATHAEESVPEKAPENQVQKAEEKVSASRRIYVHVPGNNAISSSPPVPEPSPSHNDDTGIKEEKKVVAAPMEPSAGKATLHNSENIPAAHDRYLPSKENSFATDVPKYGSEKTINTMFPDRSENRVPEYTPSNEDVFIPEPTPISSPQSFSVKKLVQKPAFVAAALVLIIAAAVTAILVQGSNDQPLAISQVLPEAPSSAEALPEVNEEEQYTAMNAAQEAAFIPSERGDGEDQAVSRPNDIATPASSSTVRNHSNEAQEVSRLAPPSSQYRKPERNTAETINDDYVKKELPMDRKEKKTWRYDELPASVDNGVRNSTERNETSARSAEDDPGEGPFSNSKVSQNTSEKKSMPVKLGDPVYTKGTLGGFYDVTIPVKNSSTAKIDLLIVEVKYVKANGDVFQTHQLSLDHLLPGESYTLKAPDSPRGINMLCSVKMASGGGSVSMIKE